MNACPYCDALEAYALLPAEPVTHRFNYEYDEKTNTGRLRQSSAHKPGLGHKMRFRIAAIPDYNIECKRGDA